MVTLDKARAAMPSMLAEGERISADSLAVVMRAPVGEHRWACGAGTGHDGRRVRAIARASILADHDGSGNRKHLYTEQQADEVVALFLSGGTRGGGGVSGAALLSRTSGKAGKA